MSDHLSNPSIIEAVKQTAFISALARGDEIIFKNFFDQYQPKIFNYINKVVKSKEVSEELVLDIFLKIWNTKELLLEVQNLDAFIYRISINKALDFLKAASKEKKLRELLAIQMDSLSATSADQEYIYKEYEQALRLTILQLPPQQKLVFNLSREGGLSHQQIAQELKISRNTVKNHMIAAIKQLRGIIKIFLFFL